MPEPRKKINLPYLFDKAARDEPIIWRTCYDHPTATFRNGRASK